MDSGNVGQRRLQAARQPDDVLGLGEDRLPGVRQFDLPAGAEKQRRSELLFQLADRFADRRLSNVQRPGRSSEAFMLGDFDHVFQMAKFHKRLLFIDKWNARDSYYSLYV